MILVKIHGMDPSTELIRQAAEQYPFDSQAVLYLGQYHGYRDAPNPVTKEVIDARDSIVAELEDQYPVTIETYTAEEQEQILAERYTDRETGDVQWPDWYTPLE